MESKKVWNGLMKMQMGFVENKKSRRNKKERNIIERKYNMKIRNEIFTHYIDSPLL